MPSHSPLYEQLADELAGLIASRVLAPGDRLPSIRHLAKQKRLSISTVMQALRLLEDRGLVDARPQAGYYVRHRSRALMAVPMPARLQAPAFVGVSNRLLEVLEAHRGDGMVPLGSALPPDELLPNERIRRIVGSIARRSPASFANGSYFELNAPVLTRQLARRALDWGQLDADEIVVTSSCTEAISLCLRAVTGPGDTIAVESATYFVLLQLLETLGLKALEIPADPVTGPSLDALELAMREGLVKACLLIPNVNNPTGTIMPEAHKKRLAALASRYDTPVIEDDVYGDLCFSAERPWPVKAYDTSGHVMLCASLSKSVSPAVRVGWVAAGRYAARVALLKTVSSGATSHFVQAVAAECIGTSGYDAQLRKMRRALQQRIAHMTDTVAAAFPQGCTLSDPQGGFVLWIRLPGQVDSMRLHQQAVQHRIAFMPGVLFSASGQMQDHLRLNCSNAWSHDVSAAVRTLGDLVREEADRAQPRSSRKSA